jgi:hypothetical protein
MSAKARSTFVCFPAVAEKNQERKKLQEAVEEIVNEKT